MSETKTNTGVASRFALALAAGASLAACQAAGLPPSGSGGLGVASGGAAPGTGSGVGGATMGVSGLGGSTTPGAGAGGASVSGGAPPLGTGGAPVTAGGGALTPSSGAGGVPVMGGAGGLAAGGVPTTGGAPDVGVGGVASGGGATGVGGAAGSGGEVNPGCPFEVGVEPSGQNWVNGEMLEFNDNGGWCWYQDERVIVDQETGEMIIASVASGGSRDSHVEVTHWNIEAGTGERHDLGAMSYADDHDVAALIKRPEGGYVAMWAGHNDDCNSYFSTFNGSSWSSRGSFAWPQCPTPSDKKITYANLWYMGDTLYSYVRSIDTSPHYLHSENGTSWTLSGRLTSTPQVGYVAGYYKYWGNNTDRIDFFGTEAHPRDNDNSLYHGYIEGGQIHRSTGEVVDSDFTDTSANEVSEYTTVFATGTTINGAQLEHMWNADLVRYDDGTVAAIGTGRVAGSGSDDPDKRLLYHRFDGASWTTTYLARAGTKLYSSEQDYTGLGALHPDNPSVIYISTSYDPRTDEGEFTGKKEIWKGVTCDEGATFDWEPVTSGSSVDNLRPVVPKWDASHTALLWVRGTYTSAQSYSFKVVGLIEDTSE